MGTGNGLTASYMKSRLAHVILEEMESIDDMPLKMNFSGPTGIPLLNLSNRRGIVFNKAWFESGGEEAMFQDVTMGISPYKWMEGQTVGNDWTPPEDNCDMDIIAMLDEAQVELDHGKRLALAHEIELAAMKLYGSFPVYWEQEAVAFWPEVRGYSHFPAPFGSYRKFMHMWIDPAHKDDTGNAGQTMGVPGGI